MTTYIQDFDNSEVDTQKLLDLDKEVLKDENVYNQETDHSDLEDPLTHYDCFLVGVDTDSDQLISMGAYRKEDEVAELKRIRVHPDYQGQGFGTDIVEALEEKAENDGAEKIKFYTAGKNGFSSAVCFYKNLGYSETDRKPYEGQEDVEKVWMEKEL